MANQNFGTFVPVNSADPDWITGWGKRNYSWQSGVSIDREVLPSLAVQAGYYRTWYGNFFVTDNLAVGPSDFSTYCVTAPSDSRLPSNVSGQVLCGLADVNPDKFGQLSQLVALSDKYGKQTEVYNGVDLNFQLRMKTKALVGGGWNIGNAVQTGTAAGGNAASRTNSCFVIDSPQQAQWTLVGGIASSCDAKVPYQSRFRVNGSYTLPYDVQVAAVYQSNPGPVYNANVAFSLAQIQPSLGRVLSGNVTSVQVNVLPQFSQYGPRINQLDLRGSKIFKFGSRKIQFNADLYNVLNSSDVVNFNSTYNQANPSTWLQPTQILDARFAKFSLQVDF
jgi:hypothetical protein